VSVAGSSRPTVGDVSGAVRRDAYTQLLLVLGVSLGASAVSAITQLIGRLDSPVKLSAQTSTLHVSQAAQSLLDLAYQLEDIVFALVPVLLALYLLSQLPLRSGIRAGWRNACRRIGFDPHRPVSDLALGTLLALAIGVPGLLLYLLAHALGFTTTVDPGNLPPNWWAIPVYLLSAAENAILEETIVLGFTFVQLRRAGWGPVSTVVAAAVLRGSYHLYQGPSAFFTNALLGLVFGTLYLRTRRVMPFVVAHTLIDSAAFVGYALLAGHVSWLPA
jgi:membrane protease YdiL (CAAX protease family)